MRFKLDENIWPAAADIFKKLGHDVESVSSEGMNGCTDSVLHGKCLEEKRCLVTLDLDFADIVRFPPDLSEGLVVLRPSWSKE